MSGTPVPAPHELSLDELRRRRTALQLEDDAVSYARRIAQARIDLVTAERRRRGASSAFTRERVIEDELRTVLSSHLTGGDVRPPRPTDDLSGHPLAVELDELCAANGLGRLGALSDAELGALADAISGFEERVSADRRARFDQLDALSAELVRRYRDDVADIDDLGH